jgi:S-adenosylmethionine:tRNA ribosyltransferase-isomerase
MRKSDFAYCLPADRIAQLPLAERTASRLLVVKPGGGTPVDGQLPDLLEHLRPGDLLVFNDTRVLPARLRCRKDSGGKVELFLERLQDTHTALFQVRSSKTLRDGQQLIVRDGVNALLVERALSFALVRFDAPVMEILQVYGETPLPPYIKRAPTAADAERYQTVYARVDGAVAAPTAGLHFDAALLDRLRQSGIGTAFITLHVGAGTFKPLPDEDVERHTLHAERVIVDAEVCDRVNSVRAQGRRIVAIGTTAVRALEAAWDGECLAPFQGETDLFIRPGYAFRVVDALLTNFHLPESTLLMLVCAFGGYQRVMRAYQHAVAAGYRFYSYGDAMFVERATDESV